MVLKQLEMLPWRAQIESGDIVLIYPALFFTLSPPRSYPGMSGDASYRRRWPPKIPLLRPNGESLYRGKVDLRTTSRCWHTKKRVQESPRALKHAGADTSLGRRTRSGHVSLSWGRKITGLVGMVMRDLFEHRQLPIKEFERW